jgi:hypothetical protein
MKFLTEIMNSAVLLNSIQKGILAIIHNSPTPQMAFEQTNGTEALYVQRIMLAKLGLITLSDATASLTQSGQAALIANNLIDEQGQLTQDAQTFIDAIGEDRETATSNT